VAWAWALNHCAVWPNICFNVLPSTF
jgi:hypothetical protein